MNMKKQSYTFTHGGVVIVHVVSGGQTHTHTHITLMELLTERR